MHLAFPRCYRFLCACGSMQHFRSLSIEADLIEGVVMFCFKRLSVAVEPVAGFFFSLFPFRSYQRWWGVFGMACDSIGRLPSWIRLCPLGSLSTTSRRRWILAYVQFKHCGLQCSSRSHYAAGTLAVKAGWRRHQVFCHHPASAWHRAPLENLHTRFRAWSSCRDGVFTETSALFSCKPAWKLCGMLRNDGAAFASLSLSRFGVTDSFFFPHCSKGFLIYHKGIWVRLARPHFPSIFVGSYIYRTCSSTSSGMTGRWKVG